MKPLAVIDVETTGLNPYRHDRVVEVAAVLVVPGQGISAELATLVNPERDIGPTSVHGLTASDIINAPRFAQIAGHLAEFLCGSIALVGHNVRFDVSFLQSEYSRIGVEMPRYASLDTMALAGGGTLSACCTEHGSNTTEKPTPLSMMRALPQLFCRGCSCRFPICLPGSCLVQPRPGRFFIRRAAVFSREGVSKAPPQRSPAMFNALPNVYPPAPPTRLSQKEKGTTAPFCGVHSKTAVLKSTRVIRL